MQEYTFRHQIKIRKNLINIIYIIYIMQECIHLGTK